MKTPIYAHPLRLGMAALLLACTQAQAQPYVGIGVGAAHQSTLCAAGAPCSDSKSGLKLLAGYRLGDTWSTELSYLRPASKFTASDSNATQVWHGSYSVQAVGVSAGYSFSTGPVQWQARAGLAHVHAAFGSATAGVPNSSANTLQPLLGLGLRYSIAPELTLRLDADITRSKAYTRSGSFSLLSVGIERRF